MNQGVHESRYWRVQGTLREQGFREVPCPSRASSKESTIQLAHSLPGANGPPEDYKNPYRLLRIGRRRIHNMHLYAIDNAIFGAFVSYKAKKMNQPKQMFS